MIIDFRLRPATRGFLNMHIFRNQERIASWSGKLGMVPPPSAKQGDMELMLKEMEEGGVTLGVVPGRQANAFMGNVPNEDIAAIVADYPEKFIGVAGIDPTNRAKALEEIERFVVNGPLKAVGMEPGVLASPMYADDRRIYPIYEYCAEHGIPVLLMGGGGNGPDLSHSNPIIIDRVCGDFPEMTVINTHGGYPWVTEILFVAFKKYDFEKNHKAAPAAKPVEAPKAAAIEAPKAEAADFVKVENVFVAEDFASRDEALSFVSNQAVKAGIAGDADAVMNAFLAREAEGTTGMMEGFAIPHAKSDAITEAAVIVVKDDSGVTGWDTMDGAPVNVAIALLIPGAQAGTTHLKILSKVAEALMDEDFRATVKGSTDAAEIAKTINARLV